MPRRRVPHCDPAPSGSLAFLLSQVGAHSAARFAERLAPLQVAPAHAGTLRVLRQADGFDMKPPREFHGGWTFYFRAPGGFLVEVFHQPGVERRGGGESFGQAVGAEEELAGSARR